MVGLLALGSWSGPPPKTESVLSLYKTETSVNSSGWVWPVSGRCIAKWAAGMLDFAACCIRR